MSSYLIVQIKIIEPQAWARYRAAVGPCVEHFGGRYIMRGGGIVEVLEGSYDGRGLAVFEFPSMERLRTFWASSEYTEVKNLRVGAAELDVWAVPGV